eukprot:CAMPEP_0184700590 /NCGR_PEP_ID=MMETSP0313-20130426/14607_1 /TAXON_ID=2792 /ORGANISM="Porphyridium aerugineum, Strain SAG 1380-2" /LENGTH=184 /DNA_ID=CAMNT_0027160339 /DNA_START=219 /DNA_END=773 /DNA_ORIENTATION=+
MAQTKQEIERVRQECTDGLNQVGQQIDAEQQRVRNIRGQLITAENQEATLGNQVKEQHAKLVNTKENLEVKNQEHANAKQDEIMLENNLQNMNEKLARLELAKREAEEIQQKAARSLKTRTEAEKALPGIQKDVQGFRQRNRELIKKMYDENREELRAFSERTGVRYDFEEATDVQRNTAFAYR